MLSLVKRAAEDLSCMTQTSIQLESFPHDVCSVGNYGSDELMKNARKIELSSYLWGKHLHYIVVGCGTGATPAAHLRLRR